MARRAMATRGWSFRAWRPFQERLLQAESQASEASVRAAYAELEVAVGSVVTEAVFLDICARAAVTHEASQEVAGAQQDAGANR